MSDATLLLRMAGTKQSSDQRERCVACGYSLAGLTSGVCPECGHPSLTASKITLRRRIGAILVAWAPCLALSLVPSGIMLFAPASLGDHARLILGAYVLALIFATFILPFIVGRRVRGAGSTFDVTVASVSFWLNVLTLLGAFVLTYEVLGHVASGV